MGLLATACKTPSGPDTNNDALVGAFGAAVRPVTGAATDYEPLYALTTNARVVLLGEATHGTHEFYRERARITQQLISSQGYAAVLIEGEWTDAYRANRYIRGEGSDASARKALSAFTGFPSWMWGNSDVADLVDWLRTYNQARPAGSQVSFYGLDLYGMYESIDAVLEYLDRVDPQAAVEARARYECFSPFATAEVYGESAGERTPGCETQAIEQFEVMRQRLERSPGALADEELFSAVQNARVVKNAERFYRATYGTLGESSWNLRDTHMAETVDAVIAHLQARGQSGKVIGWAHNSHVGDASATAMGAEGELNIGQLMRQRHASNAVLVGFTTYGGTVIAARAWGAPGERRTVRPARADSYEGAFHQVGIPNFLLILRDTEAGGALRATRLERAIGVIYLPETELTSHYFGAQLSDQFDAVVHLDQTRAVNPF